MDGRAYTLRALMVVTIIVATWSALTQYSYEGYEYLNTSQFRYINIVWGFAFGTYATVIVTTLFLYVFEDRKIIKRERKEKLLKLLEKDAEERKDAYSTERVAGAYKVQK